MGVADDVARCVHVLRRGVVVAVRVHEVARREVRHGHLDRELRVRLDRAEVRGEDKLGGRHVRSARNHTHWRSVARSSLDLRAVRERLVDRQAEVDEVVGRRRGGYLAGGGYLLAVLLEAGGDYTRVEG